METANDALSPLPRATTLEQTPAPTDQGAPRSEGVIPGIAGDTREATPRGKPDLPEGATRLTRSAEDQRVAALERELSELKARLPDADAIADKVRRHPSFQQSMRAITANQVREQLEREIETRTAVIDQMEADGELPSDVAEKRRRSVTRQVRQEYAQRPPPADVLGQEELARAARDRYVAQECAKDGVDPQDPRLDLSSPERFDRSLARILRDQAAKTGQAAAEATGKRDASARDKSADQDQTTSSGGGGQRSASGERTIRSAREDLDLLGGGGGSRASDLPDDPDALWNMSKKHVPSLRGRG